MNFQFDRLRPEHGRADSNGQILSGTAMRVVQAFELIELVEHGTPKRRREFQQDRIAALIAHARQCSAFWRSRLPPDRAPLSRLPLLRRAELRRQVESEGALPVPPDHGEIGTNGTSGTTGEPLRVHVSEHNGGFNELRYAFDDIASGRDLSKHMTFLSHTAKEEEPLDRWPSVTGNLWQTGPATILPARLLSVEENIARILAGPREHIFTYTAALTALVDHVAASGRPVRFSGEIMTSGESVLPGLRALAHEHLGAPVVDRYSCEELGPLAFQCPRQETHYHVATSNVLVETVNDLGREVAAGKPGNVLVTGLNAIATPILRYAIGDIATLLPRCPCGHDGQTLTDIKGRRLMLLRLPNGTRIGYFPRASAILAIAPVRELRLSQTGRTELVLEVAMDRPLTEAEHAGLVEMLLGEVSRDFTVRVERKERIEWGPGRKRVVVRNLLDEGF